MKKLSVLVALMLIITVGGVYATWNYFAYVTGTATQAKDTIATIALTQKVVEGEDSSIAKGSINVTNNTLAISIDDDNNDHKGELVVTGAITGTFTPDDNATDDVKANGIPLQFTLSGANLPSGLTISTTTAIITGGATKNWTIDAATIASMLSLNITLDTPEEYDVFATALGNAEITITISEYVPDYVEGPGGGGDFGGEGD